MLDRADVRHAGQRAHALDDPLEVGQPAASVGVLGRGLQTEREHARRIEARDRRAADSTAIAASGPAPMPSTIASAICAATSVPSARRRRRRFGALRAAGAAAAARAAPRCTTGHEREEHRRRRPRRAKTVANTTRVERDLALTRHLRRDRAHEERQSRLARAAARRRRRAPRARPARSPAAGSAALRDAPSAVRTAISRARAIDRPRTSVPRLTAASRRISRRRRAGSAASA